ncbi:hypothetical protein SLS62_011333 [Diatrype stigma]|uniref:N-acetyltransferase domain-containing protein n=1 Tax=Diatrype stigma TaxID=117547 RepID=A0AAN9U4F0_9PEZI
MAFGSTHARERAFADSDWLQRARNPLAQTFVAVRARDRAILSATTLMGPLPPHRDRSKPASLVISEFSSTSSQDAEEAAGPPLPARVSFEVSGVYTRRDARGRGLGAALMRAAVERATAAAAAAAAAGVVVSSSPFPPQQRGRRPLLLELKTIVYAANAGAVAFYKKCGFVTARSRRNVNPLKSPEPVTELDMYFLRRGGGGGRAAAATATTTTSAEQEGLVEFVSG